jgi:cytochrome c oxidase assembly protein subunit 15
MGTTGRDRFAMARAGGPSPWPHRIALLTCGSTLVLILFGSLVTNTGSALAVPDWPTTFGYHMLSFPWSKMVGGVFYEHMHRLIGSLVGLLTLGLALLLLAHERRRWVRWLGIVAVAAVVIQGVLGGIRVLVPSVGTTLAITHGCLAQGFFALTVGLWVVTSRSWTEAVPAPTVVETSRLRRLCLLTLSLTFAQIAAGAILTHAGVFLALHVVGAVVVGIHVAALARRIFGGYADQASLARPAVWLCALLGLQLLLGLGSYVGRFTAVPLPYVGLTGLALPAGHRIVGALMLAACVIVTLRAYRIEGSRREAVRALVAPGSVAA